MTDESPRPLLNGRFKRASIGGTFEGLHLGHRRYVELGLELADNLDIWVTSDELANSYKPYAVTPLVERLARLEQFVTEAASNCHTHFLINESTDKLRVHATGVDLDLAIVEPSYMAMFESFNSERIKAGISSFYILLKPRTVIGARDLSSTAEKRASGFAV